MKEAILFPGRFQPFHNGHVRIIEEIYMNVSDDLIINVVNSEKRTERNPFSFEIIEKMIKAVFPVDSIKVTRSSDCYIPDIYKSLKEEYDAVPFTICGEDRQATYINQILRANKYESKEFINTKLFSFQRSEKSFSGTQVRQALKNNDRKTFDELMPYELWSFYKELREQINAI